MGDPGFTDIDQALVGSRATRGVMFLVLRYAGIRIAGIAANVILSRILSPSAFGIYAITLFLLVLLTFLGDFGLSASLLQQPARVSDADLRTAFTAQQAIVAILLVALLVLAPAIATTYHLGPMGPWFVRLMLVAGLLTSLKTAPTIILERQLRYGQLSIIELADFGLFQLVAVVLALRGFGAWSFVLAVLVAKSVSTVLSYALAGWTPRFGFDPVRFRGLWRFGLPFQLSWLTYFIRDNLIPIIGGILVSTTAVGYLNWALALAGVPGQLAQIVGRVTLPALARFQDKPVALARAVEQAVRALVLAALPVHLGIIVLAPWLIHLVFSDKWGPALPALYLLSVHWSGANLTSPIVSALNAVGRPRLALALSGIWTAATLLLALVFLNRFGFVGIAAAYSVTMIGAATACVVAARRLLQVHLWRQVRVPTAAALLACGTCFLARHLLSESLPDLALLILGTGLLYATILWLAEGPRLRLEVRTVLTRPAGTVPR